MEITADYSEVVELPDGTYQARIEDCEQKTSKEGNPYLNWKLVIVSEEPKHNGAVCYKSTPMTKKGAGFLKQFLKAVLGPDAPASGGTFNTEDLLGKYLTIECKTQEDQNFPNVTKVLPAQDVAA